jgi:hypothetical protein
LKGIERLQQRGKLPGLSSNATKNAEKNAEKDAEKDAKTNANQNTGAEKGSEEIPSVKARLLQGMFKNACNIPCDVTTCRLAYKEGLILAKQASRFDLKTRSLFMKEIYTLPDQTNRPSGSGTPSNLTLSAQVQQSDTEYRRRQKRSWVEEGLDPFRDFRFSMDPSELETWPKMACATCGKRTKLYCAKCCSQNQYQNLSAEKLTKLTTTQCIPQSPSLASSTTSTTSTTTTPSSSASRHRLPQVALPIHIDILLHPQENIKKSTSLHLCALTRKQPNDCRVTVRHYPDHVPECRNFKS